MSKYANEEPMKASVGGGNYKPTPAGNHLSVCKGVVDLGTIDNTYEGKVTRKKMIQIYFEHPNLLDEEGNPFVTYLEEKFSMHKNANLRKLVNSWFAVTMTEEQAENFSAVSLLGCEAMVNVSIRTSKNGNEYNDIMGVSPIPAGVPLPKLIGEEFLFNYNLPFKTAEFELLDKLTQDKIRSSDEYLKLSGGGAQPAPAKAAAPAGATGNNPFAGAGGAQATVPPGTRPF